jgi:hypothetical protein
VAPVLLDRLVRLFVPLVLLIGPLLSPVVSRSQSLTIDQMTRRASIIVEGQVASVTADWNTAHTQIHTTVRLQSVQYYKGTGPATLDLRLLGGTVGDMTMRVIDQPAFASNERVFLFLSPNFEARDVPIVGQFQGKLRVTTNAQGQEVLVGSTQTFLKSDVESSIRSIMRSSGQ